MSATTLPAPHGQSGFSLLELLVAFAIMALSIGLLYRVAGGSASNTTDAIRNQEAVWLAESLLASRHSVLADGWNEEGQSHALHWQVRSTPPQSTPLLQPGSTSGLQMVRLHTVHLTIAWEGGNRPGKLELTTLLPERKPHPGEAQP